MHRVTQKSIKDSDIDLARVEKRLSEIAEEIKINNKNNLTDINVICEEIFGQILNKLYDIKLVSMSAEVSGNYIAVDLVDYEKRIAYQVTSQNIRNKIDRTLEKFNSSGMYKDIDEVHFLILSSDEHRYNGKDTKCLNNGRIFSYKENIMNFKKLIHEIEKKNEIENDFIVDIYDCISMVYDSGRLKYFSIVNETELLMRTATYDLDETKSWLKGYGDIHLSAFIPLSYKGELSCMLQIRQHNLSGVYITFDQEMLLEDYFVSETEFAPKGLMYFYRIQDVRWQLAQDAFYCKKRDESGNVTHVLCTVRSISDSKRREEDLKFAAEAAKREAEMKTRFLATMSQDIINNRFLEESVFAIADGYCVINLTKNIVRGSMYQVINGKKYNLNEQLGLLENN